MKNIIFVFLFLVSLSAEAAIHVVTSTQTLADLVKTIGGEYVEVDFLSRGTEDPHYVEAKPSFMVKVRDADMIVIIGLELEDAWMNNVLSGSRNPKVLPNGKGYLNLGPFVPALEVTDGTLDRGQGDVHPLGNPHYYLDPVRIKNVLPKISDKLAELMPEKKPEFEQRLKTFSETLDKKIKEWNQRIQKLKTKEVITYHKTLVYFLDRFQLTLKATIEPKPGIPPTASHSMELINLAKNDNIKCILNESHFETVAAQRISKEVKGRVSVVPTEVGALPKTDSYIQLIEQLVVGVESCK